ncbi:MAG: DUF1566 domain-containing protein, partial [Candidatus Electrothrix sp. AX5]|nr:DUF1566 domain-containing protein [Candidatus Electrothrix sp. AX5]
GFEVELVLDGNRKEIMRAFSTLRKTMTAEKDNLLIYYAGHGYLDRLSGVGYWQPVDAEQDNDIDWIPTSRVTNLLKVIQARHALIVADSCYSGNLLMRDSKAQLASGMERNAWQQRMLERRSRNALTAGGEEPVLDSGGGGHSVFAKAFLEALRGNRGIMDGDSLFDRIKNPVIANARQTPLYGVIKMTSHDWGDFLLVPEELQGRKLIGKQESKKERNFAKRGDMPQKDKRIGQYIDHGDGTITDTKTGLMWKRCSEGLSGDNCEDGKAGKRYTCEDGKTERYTSDDGKAESYNWDNAMQRFKNVAYAGYADWRLPSVNELETLLYCSKGKDKEGNCKYGSERSTINQQAFPNTEADEVWSGSPYADFSGRAWYVSFSNGHSFADDHRSFYAVRLVRDGQ